MMIFDQTFFLAWKNSKNKKYIYLYIHRVLSSFTFLVNGHQWQTKKKRHPLTDAQGYCRQVVIRGRGGSKSEFQTGIREYRGPSVGTNPTNGKGRGQRGRGRQTCGMDGAHRKLFNRWLHPHDRPPASRLISSWMLAQHLRFNRSQTPYHDTLLTV